MTKTDVTGMLTRQRGSGSPDRGVCGAPLIAAGVLPPTSLPRGITMRSIQDEQAMRSIQEGDPEKLGELMDRHWPGLLRYATQLLGSLDEAEDVAQEVFVQVWQHRARWTPGGSVRAYLYRIARNLVLARSRHEGVKGRAEPELRRRAGRVVTPVESVVQKELRDAFEKALRELPYRRREAFVLVRIQGMGLREAADVMGVTRRTVANQVYLAAKDLESALRPFLPD